MRTAKNEALPSLKAAGTYGYQAQNTISPQNNYSDKGSGVFSYQYPVMQGSLDLSYPIMDKGVKAGIRDAEIQKRQVSLEEADLTKAVSDDVKTRIDILKASFQVMENAKRTEEESKNTTTAFYVLSNKEGSMHLLSKMPWILWSKTNCH